MVPEADVLSAACEILSSLPIGEFKFKLNHRKLLDSMMEICDVPKDKLRAISSSIDKLDKLPWSEVAKEMNTAKGLPMTSVDKIKKYVEMKGNPKEILNEFKSNKSWFGDNKVAIKALDELEILFNYLESMDVLKFIEFDMSLARGLDYYTGVIYEAVLLDEKIGVGSISAGGRYDNLVGMFSGKETPCVGVSIGVERVFAIIEKQEELSNNLLKKTKTSVYIASIGDNLINERMKIAALLWKNNISAEFSYSCKGNITKQLNAANEKQCRFAIIFGEDEIKNNKLKIKSLLETKGEKEVVVEKDKIIEKLLELGCEKVKVGVL